MSSQPSQRASSPPVQRLASRCQSRWILLPAGPGAPQAAISALTAASSSAGRRQLCAFTAPENSAPMSTRMAQAVPARVCRAALTTASTVKPNLPCSSLRGAEAPKVSMPMARGA